MTTNNTPSNNIQDILDTATRLANAKEKEAAEDLYKVIRIMRGPLEPWCFGQDDCSTYTLVRCPWNFDCGK